MPFKYILAVLCLSIYSCTAPPPGEAPLSQAEHMAISDTLQVFLHRYFNAIREHGLLAEFEYLDSSQEFSWQPPGHISQVPRDSIYEMIRNNASRFSSIDNHWDTLRISPLSRAKASYKGYIHSAMTDTQGKLTEINLAEEGTLIRRNNGWKLLSGNTVIVNP